MSDCRAAHRQLQALEMRQRASQVLLADHQGTFVVPQNLVLLSSSLKHRNCTSSSKRNSKTTNPCTAGRNHSNSSLRGTSRCLRNPLRISKTVRKAKSKHTFMISRLSRLPSTRPGQRCALRMHFLGQQQQQQQLAEQTLVPIFFMWLLLASHQSSQRSRRVHDLAERLQAGLQDPQGRHSLASSICVVAASMGTIAVTATPTRLFQRSKRLRTGSKPGGAAQVKAQCTQCLTSSNQCLCQLACCPVLAKQGPSFAKTAQSAAARTMTNAEGPTLRQGMLRGMWRTRPANSCGVMPVPLRKNSRD